MGYYQTEVHVTSSECQRRDRLPTLVQWCLFRIGCPIGSNAQGFFENSHKFPGSIGLLRSRRVMVLYGMRPRATTTTTSWHGFHNRTARRSRWSRRQDGAQRLETAVRGWRLTGRGGTSGGPMAHGESFGSQDTAGAPAKCQQETQLFTPWQQKCSRICGRCQQS
jgi:hypothetical protein